MGRPLNKDFFGDTNGLLKATLAWLPGAGSAVACHILRQRSNLKYEVANEATVNWNALVVGAKYIIVTAGDGDWTSVGAANNSVGTRFTATGTDNGGSAGTAREYAVCKLQRATPAADFEMHIEVQPENADTPAEFTAQFGTTGGVVDSVTLVTPGYGYWSAGTFNISVASDGGYVAGTEAEIAYTVAGGRVTSLAINSGGTGYTADLANTTAISATDTPDEAATPPVEYARIINSRVVKTYEDGGGIYGNTYPWPTGVSGRQAGVTEADIDVQP